MCSCSYQPAPRPSSTRPPDIWSTLATAIASTPGSRNVPAVTSVPEPDRRGVPGEPGEGGPRIGRTGQAAGLECLAHRQVVVAAEEGAEPELLGTLGDGEEVVVGRPCCGSVKMRSWLRSYTAARLRSDVTMGVRGPDRPATVDACDRVHGYGRRRCPIRLPTLPPARAALREHVLQHSVKRGDFTLKSGAHSSWFVDAKQTACRPDGILLVADAALEIIPDDATAIGGLTVGADPVAYGVAAVAATRGRRCAASRCARRPRTTASSGASPAPCEPGDRVVITEDAVTRGTSLFEAVDVVRAVGAEPVLITVIVDRGGTCAALAAAAGIAYEPLLTAEDLGFASGS